MDSDPVRTNPQTNHRPPTLPAHFILIPWEAGEVQERQGDGTIGNLTIEAVGAIPVTNRDVTNQTPREDNHPKMTYAIVVEDVDTGPGNAHHQLTPSKEMHAL